MTKSALDEKIESIDNKLKSIERKLDCLIAVIEARKEFKSLGLELLSIGRKDNNGDI